METPIKITESMARGAIRGRQNPEPRRGKRRGGSTREEEGRKKDVGFVKLTWALTRLREARDTWSHASGELGFTRPDLRLCSLEALPFPTNAFGSHGVVPQSFSSSHVRVTRRVGPTHQGKETVLVDEVSGRES